MLQCSVINKLCSSEHSTIFLSLGLDATETVIFAWRTFITITAYGLETSSKYQLALQKVVFNKYNALYFGALKCFLKDKTVTTGNI